MYNKIILAALTAALAHVASAQAPPAPVPGAPGRPAPAQAPAQAPAPAPVPAPAAAPAPAPAATPAPASAGRAHAPANAQVYFIWPSDGKVIHKGKFWVRMGLRNMGVAPKGTDMQNTGHHHLLIDTDLPTNMDRPIPSDRNHLHFGAGETEARVELPPGKHTLQLLLGDKNHVPHDPPVYSKKITVTVK